MSIKIIKPPVKFSMDTVTFEQYREDYKGFCIYCGSEHDCIEPDARKYQCENCNKAGVYGTEELLIMGRITIVNEGEA